MKQLPAFAAAVLLCAGAAPCRAQDPDALSLEVSIEHKVNTLPVIHWAKNGNAIDPHIRVILKNISRTPQPIWVSSFLAIEITDVAGRKWAPQPSENSFLSVSRDSRFVDIGGMRDLQPGGTIIFNMFLARTAAKENPNRVLTATQLSNSAFFDFTSAHPEARDAYPSGVVTLWIRCRVNIADTWLDDGIAARPVKCVID